MTQLPILLRMSRAVFRKEMLEILRDRRTLVMLLLLPVVLYPVGSLVALQWMSVVNKPIHATKTTVRLVGECWPQLKSYLAADKKIHVACEPHLPKSTSPDSAAHAVRVFIPSDYQHQLDRYQSIKITVSADPTRVSWPLVQEHISDRLQIFSDQLLKDRLTKLKLSNALTRPLDVKLVRDATPQQQGRWVLGRFFPLFLVLFVLLGAYYPAIELVAGERERGTASAIYLTPAPPTAIVAGKYAALLTIGFITAVIHLLSIVLTLKIGLSAKFPASVAYLPWSSIGLGIMALVPTVCFSAAVMMLVSCWATGFKEAQALMTPTFVLLFSPALIVLFPDMKLSVALAWVPLINLPLLTRALMEQSVPIGAALIVIATCALYIWGLLYLGAATFAPAKHRRMPNTLGLNVTPIQFYEVTALLFIVLALLLFVGHPLQLHNLIAGMIATQWLCIALPVVIFLHVTGRPIANVLSIHPASSRSVLGAFLAAISAWYLIAIVIEGIQQRFLPIPKEFLQQMQQLLFATQRPLWLDLFALAVSPAVCEELLFRGVVLSAARQYMTVPRAVLLNGILFGLFHLSVYRFVSTGMLGIVLAMIVVRSGSILPAMLFHAVNNSIALVLGRYFGDASPDQLPVSSNASFLLLLIVVPIFVTGLRLISRNGPKA